ncbi:MAG: hypothetical protein ABI210_10190 [Abditibacteriaceae bacterium]
MKTSFMDSLVTNTSLIDVLKNRVIPQVERNGMKDIFTARGAWKPLMDLPEDMTPCTNHCAVNVC